MIRDGLISKGSIYSFVITPQTIDTRNLYKMMHNPENGFQNKDRRFTGRKQRKLDVACIEGFQHNKHACRPYMHKERFVTQRSTYIKFSGPLKS